MKLFNKYTCIFLSICMMSACSESFLDRQPLDQEVSSNFYKTEEDAQQAIVAVYDVLGYQSTPGISWSPFQIMADILSDDSYAGGADANDGMDEDELNNFLISTNNQIVHSIWSRNYVGIYRANLFLEIIDGIDADDGFKARTSAEAKFLRAYFYFEQVRFFENIPLLTATIKGPSEYSQTQNSPQEVYNQIALDLVEAIEDLPESVPQAENGRITKWAAQALLGRVYLFYNGVYGDDLEAGATNVNKSFVLSQLEDIIANSEHDLLEEYASIFRLANEFSKESIFEVSFGDSPAWWDWGYVRGGEGNLSAQMQGPRVSNSDMWNRGWSFGTVSQTLINSFGDDPRLDATVLFEDELDGSLVKGYQHTGYYSQKYSSDVEHWGEDGQFELNRKCNYRVLRYSDVLLMAAELGSPNAQEYFNEVRARVGLPSIPVTPENIFKERHLEFALEGIRYFDVLRQGLDVAEEVLTIQGVRGPDYIGDQLLFDITFDPITKGFLPVPQAEIDLSGGVLTQNQGY